MKSNLFDLRQKCLILVNYLKEKGGGETMNQLSKTVEQSYYNKNEKGLTIMLRDLTEWVSGFLNYKKKDIDLIIGKLIDDYKFKVLELLKKRKISTDEEYTLLYNYLSQNHGEIEECVIQEINKLLLKYESIK
jgi:hypothetical protein